MTPLPNQFAGMGKLLTPTQHPQTQLLRIRPKPGQQQEFSQPGYGIRAVAGGDHNALLRFVSPSHESAFPLATGAVYLREAGFERFWITWPNDYNGTEDFADMYLELYQTKQQGLVVAPGDHDGDYEFTLADPDNIVSLGAGAQQLIAELVPGQSAGADLDPTARGRHLSRAMYVSGYVTAPNPFKVRAFQKIQSGTNNPIAFADIVSLATVEDGGAPIHHANLDCAWQVFTGAGVGGVSFIELWTLRRLIVPINGVEIFILNTHGSAQAFNYRVGFRSR